ncbi:uncharacterized protein LOC121976430 [Zingiber officinale]|uniref:RAB6-interacting golgin n=1 Tax=Zingiber officinale TaxID=94328 RepID=A0A8J5L4S3_ZINOF|nr:uncharacterized protein LOC121976430 [Zingiber officinale]KAG6512155.1 hypothetical protein ZIOFF_030250 [Zingiber officinale]
MASPPLPTAPPHPSLLIEIGPDGIARESPVIAYTEKIIEAEQLQLKRYIQENYSKIREVERELESLTLELKLTAGPKKAALEHMRKKIELSTEKIRAAKLKEEQAKKAWEAAVQAVKDEEAIKQKLCDDLNQLVQESTSTQFLRLEELKRRLEALNPNKVSSDAPDGKLDSNAVGPPMTVNQSTSVKVPNANAATNSSESTLSDAKRQVAEVKDKKRVMNTGRTKGSMILPKERGPVTGWTGSGFDVDSST